MKKFLSTAALITAGVLASSTASFAQSSTDSFGVSLTVEDECSITAAGPLGFGTTGGIIDENVDALTTINVVCSAGSEFEVGLSAGANADEADTTTRAMISGTNAVDYDLYTDAGRTDVWGNTQGDDTVAVEAATGATETLTVYGRVPAGQNVAAGAYDDTITATIWYGTEIGG